MEVRRIVTFVEDTLTEAGDPVDPVLRKVATPYGNVLRDAAGGGAAWISSATKRAQPGASIDIPLAYKDALYVRSHYDAMSITLHDAPLADEIAVVCCFANRGRPHHRVGGLTVHDAVGQDGLT